MLPLRSTSSWCRWCMVGNCHACLTHIPKMVSHWFWDFPAPHRFLHKLWSVESFPCVALQLVCVCFVFPTYLGPLKKKTPPKVPKLSARVGGRVCHNLVCVGGCRCHGGHVGGFGIPKFAFNFLMVGMLVVLAFPSLPLIFFLSDVMPIFLFKCCSIFPYSVRKNRGFPPLRTPPPPHPP